MIRYFRRYNKIIFWIVVILILPLFSVTWVMMEVVGRKEAPPAGTLYGEEVRQEDFALEKRRLAAYFRVMGRDQDFRDEAVLEHLAFRKKADQAGIEVSDEELAEEVRDIYAQMEGARRAALRLGTELRDEEKKNEQRVEAMLRRLSQQEAAKVVFDPERYADAIAARGTNAGEFEKALRDQLRIQKLFRLVAASEKAPIEKVWERYQSEYHKRQMRYVTFTADFYASPDPAKIGDDELRRFYSRHEDRFREPKKVSVEWVAAPISAFEKDAKEPTPDEIQARYDQVKEARYRLPDERRPAPEVTGTAAAPLPATTTAEPRFRPLAEVKEDIVRELRKERRQELARQKVEEVRTKLAADQSLEDAAKAAGLSYGKTGLMEPEKLLDEKAIAHYLVLRAADNLAAGAVSETLANDEGAFFIRIAEKKEERTPPFEEIAAKVKEVYLVPPDDEVTTYFNRNLGKYREPEKDVIEYVSVPYAQLERSVPESVTGAARQDELRKRAEERIEEVRKALAAPEGGKVRDLESVALEKNVAHAQVIVEKSGKDLPAEARGGDIIARLASSADKAGGDLSPTFENEARTGVYAYRVKERIAPRTPPLPEVREKVLKDLLEERASERARDAATDFLKAVSPDKPLEPEAARRALSVTETALLAKTDEIPGVKGSRAVVGALFRLQDLGHVGGPIEDREEKTWFVIRYVAREAADPAGFAAKEREIREQMAADEKQLMRFGIAPEFVRDWEQSVKLEARGVGPDVLREVYDLRYGEGGLARIEARHLYIAADKKTIEEEMDRRAKAQAEAILARARAGEKFQDLARDWSDDEQTKARGGNLGTISRGKMPKEFDDAAWAARAGEIVGPVRTRLGWHVIQVVEHRGEDVRVRHILFSVERRKNPQTGEWEPLDPEVRKVAIEKSREKAEKALARLEAGEDFAKVAKDLSDDPEGAEKREYEFQTPFERAVLGLKPQELSAPIVEKNGAHLVLASPFRGDERHGGRREPGTLAVQHIFARGENGAAKLERIRAALLAKQKAAEGEDATGRAAWQALSKAFEEAAKKESEAPSGKRGGRIGIFEPDPNLAKYGPAFRDALYALEPGKLSGIIESREGLSIVLVTERKKKTFEEAKQEIGEGLLAGIEF